MLEIIVYASGLTARCVFFYYYTLHLLSPLGKIKGLSFNRFFFEKQGPPFGDDLATNEQLFKGAFEIEKIDICRNSIFSRFDTEFSITFAKKKYR